MRNNLLFLPAQAKEGKLAYAGYVLSPIFADILFREGMCFFGSLRKRRDALLRTFTYIPRLVGRFLLLWARFHGLRTSLRWWEACFFCSLLLFWAPALLPKKLAQEGMALGRFPPKRFFVPSYACAGENSSLPYLFWLTNILDSPPLKPRKWPTTKSMSTN